MIFYRFLVYTESLKYLLLLVDCVSMMLLLTQSVHCLDFKAFSLES